MSSEKLIEWKMIQFITIRSPNSSPYVDPIHHHTFTQFITIRSPNSSPYVHPIHHHTFTQFITIRSPNSSPYVHPIHHYTFTQFITIRSPNSSPYVHPIHHHTFTQFITIRSPNSSPYVHPMMVSRWATSLRWNLWLLYFYKFSVQLSSTLTHSRRRPRYLRQATLTKEDICFDGAPDNTLCDVIKSTFKKMSRPQKHVCTESAVLNELMAILNLSTFSGYFRPRSRKSSH